MEQGIGSAEHQCGLKLRDDWQFTERIMEVSRSGIEELGFIRHRLNCNCEVLNED